MQIRRILKPGQNGTRKLTEEYGDRLLCVRYIYDDETNVKLKTVEIIVDKKPWHKDGKRIPGNKIVGVHVAYGEIRIGRLIRSAGGKWNRQSKVWELPYREVLALGLAERIKKT